MSRSHLYITGNLGYTPRKITLTSGDISYFVRPYSIQSGYIHGDRVRARITKRWDGGRLAEVEIISLVSRSRDPLLARVISKKWKQYLKIIPEQGNLEVPFFAKDIKYDNNSIISVRFGANDRVEVVSVWGYEDDIDLDERLILWLSRARTEFPGSVIRESEEVKEKASKSEKIPLTPFLKGEPNIPKFQNSKIPPRTDFRNWYTLTIDGSDAKDLDDAISIRQEQNGDYTLAVHIADVAEYVTEWSSLDREALARATSIYTPGKVIPMLPEIISNDLCSLHPGTMKLTLSAVMTIDARWYVRHTDIVEWIIESQHRGVYDDIYAMMRSSNAQKKDTEKQMGVRGGSTVQNFQQKISSDDEISDKISEAKNEWVWLPLDAFDTFCTKSMENGVWLEESIVLATSLYHILEKRRRKEGKITFESTEIYFDFENDIKSWVQKTPKYIKRRERNDAHKLIEEFMVLANEEVAKWCKKHDLPFLSRVHGLPGNEQTEIINTILAHTSLVSVIPGLSRDPGNNNESSSAGSPHTWGWQKVLEPTHIREFLENISDPTELYRYSRLLLPKMAKATYSDTPFRHFGLALEYYSHFTSPIRRYPDLQVHRIIKEKIRGELTPERISYYKALLKRVARNCSERERWAEDIERAMNSLYICRYMADKVNKIYDGQISGLAEFALFVELENGIEATLYLPRGRYNIDSVSWVLTDPSGKRLGTIGEKIRVKLESVNMTERRVVVERV